MTLKERWQRWRNRDPPAEPVPGSEISGAPSLEYVIYDLARHALDEQRDLVAGLRSRAAPVLAGAGALAALLAKPAIGTGVTFTHGEWVHGVLVGLGILGGVIAIGGAILVLATREFAFSVDAGPLYENAYADRDAPDIYLLRIAGSHREARIRNAPAVTRVQRFLAGGLIGVVVEVAGFATAIAVH